MADINFKDLGKLIERAIDKTLNREFIKDLAEETTETIVKRARTGRGVKETLGKPTKFTTLTSNYKSQRKNLRKNKTLSTQTSPAKSNATKTGKLLDSIEYNIIKDGFIIEPKGSHNRTKVQEIAQRGTVFMNLSKPDFNKIFRMFRDRLKKLTNN